MAAGGVFCVWFSPQINTLYIFYRLICGRGQSVVHGDDLLYMVALHRQTDQWSEECRLCVARKDTWSWLGKFTKSNALLKIRV